MEKQNPNMKKKIKYIFVPLLILLSALLVLIFLVRNSTWYHNVFDSDAVSLGKFLRKEKMDAKVTKIQSAYLVDESGQEVKVELPLEFWAMIANDFTKLSWGKAIKYRIHLVSQPIDDFKIISRNKIIELELMSAKLDEPVLVKIYKEGYLWTSLKAESEFMIGTAYAEGYYKEGLKYMEEDFIMKKLPQTQTVENNALYEINSERNRTKEFVENQAKAISAYTSFFQYYYEQQCKSGIRVNGYTVNGVSSEFIPDFYGGSYVNKLGNLVIEVTNSYNTPDFYQGNVYKEILRATGAESKDIVIRFVDVAYNNLMNGMTEVEKYVLSESEIDSLGFGIDDYNNEIEIDVPVSIDKKDKIEIFLKEKMTGIPYKINYDTFDFIDETGVYPGEDVYNQLGTFSLAFPAEILVSGNYKTGYMTCAHAFTGLSSSDVHIGDGPCIGTFSSSHSNYGGTSDAAFVETNSSAVIYHTLYLGTTTIRSSYCYLSQGCVVYKNGAMTRITSGEVKNTSYSMKVSGTSFTDLVTASYDSDSGDSGAIVYSEPDAVNYAYVVGIHKGKTSLLSGRNAIYTKASNALNDLGAIIS